MPEGAPLSDGLFPDLRPHHFCVSVPDLEASIAWWRELFGFDVDFRFRIPHIGAKAAFVRRGAFRIELFEIDGSAPAPSERLNPNSDLREQGGKHICFSVEDPQVALEALFERGATIVGVRRGEGPMRPEADPRLNAEPGRQPAMAVFIRDPAGALVELVRRADFGD